VTVNDFVHLPACSAS